MLYYLPIALNVFCIYHIIKNKISYHWIFLIIFIPIIGSIVYILMNVINKQDVEKVQDGLTAVINPTKKVKELSKKLAFSDTFQNKVDLADAYFELNDFKNAITYYENAIDSNFSGDTYVISKLIDAHYYVKNYDKAINYYKQLFEITDIIKPKNQLHYGLSLANLGKPKSAERAFKKIDINFSNYNERLAFAEFLVEKKKNEKAKKILQEILDESKHFTKSNRKIYRQTIAVVKSILNKL